MRDLKNVITESLTKYHNQEDEQPLVEGKVARLVKRLGALAAAAAVGAGAVAVGGGGSADSDKEYVSNSDGDVVGYRDRSIKAKRQRSDDRAHWDRDSGEVYGYSNDRIR